MSGNFSMGAIRGFYRPYKGLKQNSHYWIFFGTISVFIVPISDWNDFVYESEKFSFSLVFIVPIRDWNNNVFTGGFALNVGFYRPYKGLKLWL